MQKLIAKCALLLGLALAAPLVLGESLAPDAVLRAVSADVIDKITNDKAFHGADPAKVTELVETRILPLFDLSHMTRLAVAHNWRYATPEQQIALTQEFRTLLVRTYSSALEHYRGEIIDFKQLRATPSDTDATVRSQVIQPGKERLTMDYSMENTPEGWKIYDIKVAGVRLVTTYRDVFAEKMREGGVNGLIKYLADSNRAGDSRFKTIKTAVWEKSRLMLAIFQDVFRSGLK